MVVISQNADKAIIVENVSGFYTTHTGEKHRIFAEFEEENDWTLGEYTTEDNANAAFRELLQRITSGKKSYYQLPTDQDATELAKLPY